MSENNKVKLLTILEIMKKTDELHPLNATQIFRELERLGINGERKSISRDIKSLTDAGYSIKKCENHNLGYYMTDQLFEDYELKILADSVGAAKFLTAKDSLALMKKVISLATVEGQALIHATTFPDSELKSDDSHNKMKLDLVVKAIKGRKKISFQYFEIGKNGKRFLKRDGYRYTISPYFVTLFQEEYFIIGNPENHSHATHFRMELMTNMQMLEESVRTLSEIEEFVCQGNPFDITVYLRQNVNMWTGPVTEVSLNCRNSIRHDIQMQFGKNVLMMDVDDNHFQVHVKVTDNDGVYQWIARFGTDIQILQPESVRQKFLDYLKSIAAMYEKSGG